MGRKPLCLGDRVQSGAGMNDLLSTWLALQVGILGLLTVMVLMALLPVLLVLP